MTQDYRFRRGAISAYGRASRSANTLLLFLLCSCVAVAVIAMVLLFSEDGRTVSRHTTILLLAAISIAACGLIWWYAKRHFIEPDLAFRKWLQQVCDGELEARIELPESHRHHRELDFHTRNLANALNSLSTDMEGLVESQTHRLAQQNSSLDLLYNLTADLSRETRLRTVLETTCRYLADWFGLADVTAWQLTAGGPQKLAAIYQLDPPLIKPSVPTASKAECPVQLVSELTICTHSSSPQLAIIRLPYFNAGVPQGLVELITDKSAANMDDASRRVLNSVSEQLSLFSAKQAAIAESRESAMMRDRAALAAEIHDSLAQTLAALRYRVSVIQDEAKRANNVELRDALAGIDAMVGEVNHEVRGLISEYRKPLASHRSAESLSATVESFRAQSGVQVFFQTSDPQIHFSVREESQIQRIVGEALNNAARYAQASMIRVYLRRDDDGVRRIIIEDDGIGFDWQSLLQQAGAGNGDGGNHIGLSIMRERAATIGAMLEIDSEPGDGTRISIDLPPNSKFDQKIDQPISGKQTEAQP